MMMAADGNEGTLKESDRNPTRNDSDAEWLQSSNMSARIRSRHWRKRQTECPPVRRRLCRLLPG